MRMLKRLKRAIKELLGRPQHLEWEAPLLQTYEDQIYAGLVKPGDICFDIGANQGDVSLLLARLVRESGLVVACEPVWPMYSRLCQRAQTDRSLKAPIVTIPLGLADTNQVATIQVPDGNFGMGSMATPLAWEKAQPGAVLESYQVQFVTLDSLLASTQLPLPTFMKIDVEGAELFVLQGAANLFARGHRPLMLIEVFAPWEKSFNYHPWQPLSWLLERGYQILFACPNGLVDHVPTPTHPFPPDYEMGYNIVAYCPDLHRDRLEGIQHLRAEGQPQLKVMYPPPQPNRP